MPGPQIDWAECELAGYQRGFLMVRFDFVHNVLIWKDSNRWFNNYVRGLPREKMTGYRQHMADLLSVLEANTPAEPELPADYIWHISVGKEGEDACLTVTGTDVTTDTWHELALMIEDAGGRSFKL